MTDMYDYYASVVSSDAPSSYVVDTSVTDSYYNDTPAIDVGVQSEDIADEAKYLTEGSTLDSLGNSLGKAASDFLTIGTNAYGAYRADQLARAYEKDAKAYVSKAENLSTSNIDYLKGRQSEYDKLVQQTYLDSKRGTDLSLQNALQAERAMNNWTSVFGSTQEALGKYYGGLDEASINAFKVNELNDQFEKAKKSLATTFAQRGLAGSGAEAEAYLNLEMSSAYTKAKSIYETKAEIAKQQQEWMNTGYNQQNMLMGNRNNAVNLLNSSNSNMLGTFGQLSANTNNAMSSAMNAGTTMYTKLADFNYAQAGNMNAAAYGMAQQAATAGGSSSGSKSSGMGKAIGAAAGYFSGIPGGSIIGGALGEAAEGILGGIL